MRRRTPTTDPTDCTSTLGVRRDATACVAVVHACHDAPPLDVRSNGRLLVEEVPTNTATAFLALSAGDHRLGLVPSVEGVTGPVLTVDPLRVEAGKAYEVVAHGRLAGVTASVFDVDHSATPVSWDGRRWARFRCVHVAEGARVDHVDLEAAKVRVRVCRDLLHGEASRYVEVTAGAYELEVSVNSRDMVATFKHELRPATVTSLYVIWQADNPIWADFLPVSTAVSPVWRRRPSPAEPPGG